MIFRTTNLQLDLSRSNTKELLTLQPMTENVLTKEERHFGVVFDVTIIFYSQSVC